jgi:hypothetical protein
MDYLVLMQRQWADKPTYLDVPGVIYHYPERYFPYINGFERFVYYRPARGATAGEASTYFGFGTLAQPFPDPVDPTHRYVGILQYQDFKSPVSYDDSSGAFYESTYRSRTAFTGRSVRRIAPTDFFRILAAAGLTGDPYARLADTEQIIAGVPPMSPLLPIVDPPRQPLRDMPFVPKGTGYRPTGTLVDVYESAALQERARADHQRVLRVLHERVAERGGKTLFNNNIDMFAVVRDQRLLIEAKSVNAPHVAVDRMRYGIGQLADYAVRYRSELADSQRVLAFGSLPSHDASWISTILQQNDVAFVGLAAGDQLVALNERAEKLTLFV